MLVIKSIDGTASAVDFSNDLVADTGECEWCEAMSEVYVVSDTHERTDHTLCRDCISTYNILVGTGDDGDEEE